MKIDFPTLWKKILHPPKWAKVLTFIVTVISCAASILLLFVDYAEDSIIAILSYLLYAVAALTLTYSVYLLIPIVRNAKTNIVAWMENHKYTNRYLHDFGFKTIITTVMSFAMSFINGCINGYLGIVNKSIWYGALAMFYIALAFVRGGVLFYHSRRLIKKDKNQNDDFAKAKVYLGSGIATLILNLALSSAIAQMIFSNAHFEYVGWTIFYSAAYAFYKITMSIISFIKAHKQTDLTVRAVRNINLVDALVSILALQTALLTVFSDPSVNISLYNTLTGTAVSLSAIAIGIYMIVSASKTIKKLQKEETNNEQSI